MIVLNVGKIIEIFKNRILYCFYLNVFCHGNNVCEINYNNVKCVMNPLSFK